jgi:hypothetical protein
VAKGQEDMMKSLLAMILAMTVSMPAGSWAQQDQAALRRVHLMDRHRHYPAQSGQPARISPLCHHWRTAADRQANARAHTRDPSLRV